MTRPSSLWAPVTSPSSSSRFAAQLQLQLRSRGSWERAAPLRDAPRDEWAVHQAAGSERALRASERKVLLAVLVQLGQCLVGNVDGLGVALKQKQRQREVHPVDRNLLPDVVAVERLDRAAVRGFGRIEVIHVAKGDRHPAVDLGGIEFLSEAWARSSARRYCATAFGSPRLPIRGCPAWCELPARRGHHAESLRRRKLDRDAQRRHRQLRQLVFHSRDSGDHGCRKALGGRREGIDLAQHLLDRLARLRLPGGIRQREKPTANCAVQLAALR